MSRSRSLAPSHPVSVKTRVLRARPRAGPRQVTLYSQGLPDAALGRGIKQFPVSCSSSGFLHNGSRLLGISVSGVPVFVRCADSYQGPGQNSPWWTSNFPESWQVETFHLESAPSREDSWPPTSRHTTLGGAGFCAVFLLSWDLAFLTLCVEGIVLAPESE